MNCNLFGPNCLPVTFVANGRTTFFSLNFLSILVPCVLIYLTKKAFKFYIGPLVSLATEIFFGQWLICQKKDFDKHFFFKENIANHFGVHARSCNAFCLRKIISMIS